MLRVEAARQIATKRDTTRHGLIDIDQTSDEAHVVSSGIWIAAWVFVSNEDIRAALPNQEAAE